MSFNDSSTFLYAFFIPSIFDKDAVIIISRAISVSVTRHVVQTDIPSLPLQKSGKYITGDETLLQILHFISGPCLTVSIVSIFMFTSIVRK